MADPVVTSPLDMSDTRTHIERINDADVVVRHGLPGSYAEIVGRPTSIMPGEITFVRELPDPVVATTLPAAEYEDAPDIDIDDETEMDEDLTDEDLTDKLA